MRGVPKTARPLTPLPAASPVNESNRYLVKLKTSLARRWSHTRRKELYEQADLARYLWALEREAEALDMVRSVTSAVPLPGRLPNYNVWCPVVTMDALEARGCRLAGEEAAAAGSRRTGPGRSRPRAEPRLHQGEGRRRPRAPGRPAVGGGLNRDGAVQAVAAPRGGTSVTPRRRCSMWLTASSSSVATWLS